MSSVRFQSSTLNSGVARTRLGCETTLRRTQVVWGRRSRNQFNQFIPAIAERLSKRIAKEIALGHDADQKLAVIIENRQMANPAQPHDIGRPGEVVIAFKSGWIRCHDVANFEVFHTNFPKSILQVTW